MQTRHHRNPLLVGIRLIFSFFTTVMPPFFRDKPNEPALPRAVRDKVTDWSSCLKGSFVPTVNVDQEAHAGPPSKGLFLRLGSKYHSGFGQKLRLRLLSNGRGIRLMLATVSGQGLSNPSYSWESHTVIRNLKPGVSKAITGSTNSGHQFEPLAVDVFSVLVATLDTTGAGGARAELGKVELKSPRFRFNSWGGKRREWFEFGLRPSEVQVTEMTTPRKLHNCSTAFNGSGSWSFGFSLSRINALTKSFSSPTTDETAGEKELLYSLGNNGLAFVI
ncbi:hypothetical protein Tco_0405410 [Tanacetum coccineum]|uniref:NADH:ubiquinone oxidoreductase intermediate-associated protein 30 domain-containing protein n=1 Tax=Tanacetum coccineum TaxID=301880 RepID=A0ABQ5FIY2_9ASTR